jgi:UPF0271 protein
MASIDLNCDVGDNPAAESMDTTAALLDVVSSVNIACGVHAGDPLSVAQHVRLAVGKRVAIGAHPGFPDRASQGRQPLSLDRESVYWLVVYQVGAVHALVRSAGGQLTHVKPHGALYNSAAVDRTLADAIASAVRSIDPHLALVGLCNSQLIEAGRGAGLPAIAEAFADRAYERDGTLVSRDRAGAMIVDERAAVAQALSIARSAMVRSHDDVAVALAADTLCIHGDGPHALAFARAVRHALEDSGITIRART